MENLGKIIIEKVYNKFDIKLDWEVKINDIKKILILEGGCNEEHEVSLETSSEIQKYYERLN